MINSTVSQSATHNNILTLACDVDDDSTVLPDLRYTMSLTSRSESPDVSPAASMVQKYTPLSHHITSVMTRSASADTHQALLKLMLLETLIWINADNFRENFFYFKAHNELNEMFNRTVLNGDLALSVLRAQGGLIDAPLLDDCADCALAVGAVVGRILTKLQSCLIGFKNTKQWIPSQLNLLCYDISCCSI